MAVRARMYVDRHVQVGCRGQQIVRHFITQTEALKLRRDRQEPGSFADSAVQLGNAMPAEPGIHRAGRQKPARNSVE